VGILNDIHPNGRMTIPFDREKKHVLTMDDPHVGSNLKALKTRTWTGPIQTPSGNQTWQLKIPYKWI
jgi:hypothetical protein